MGETLISYLISPNHSTMISAYLSSFSDDNITYTFAVFCKRLFHAGLQDRAGIGLIFANPHETGISFAAYANLSKNCETIDITYTPHLLLELFIFNRIRYNRMNTRFSLCYTVSIDNHSIRFLPRKSTRIRSSPRYVKIRA